MKRGIVSIVTLIAMIATLASCKKKNEENDVNGGSVDYPRENYLGYIRVVSEVLSNDALHVYACWAGLDNLDAEDAARAEENEFAGVDDEGYVTEIVDHNHKPYTNTKDVINQIIDGCIDIATEVADSKMGEPYDNGDVYGVESWYSFYSYTDYQNNIRSIANALRGGIAAGELNSMAATRDEDKSVLAYIASKGTEASKATADVKTLLAKVDANFDELKSAGCFRDVVLAKGNGQSNANVVEQMELIKNDLVPALEALKSYVPEDDAAAQDAIDNFAEKIALPTYQELKEQADVLAEKVAAFAEDPSQENLNAVCAQWKTTRHPWEFSEAFLFGPVKNYSIDPHLDSWPLSQVNINAILNANLDWSTQDGSSMGESTLGFHTLEYLTFRNGAPRDINELFAKDGKATLESTTAK